MQLDDRTNLIGDARVGQLAIQAEPGATVRRQARTGAGSLLAGLPRIMGAVAVTLPLIALARLVRRRRPVAVQAVPASSAVDVEACEHALQQSRLFKLLVSSVTDYGIYMLDTHGRIATWNKGAQALKGYSEAEVLGKPLSTFFTPEDVAAGKPAYLMRLARERGHVEDEGWRVRKDGTRFWVNAVLTAIHDASGRLQGYAKITRDLTERRLAEEALLRKASELEGQQRLLASIVENVPAAIAYLDRDLVYRWNNRAHCEMAGLPKDAIIGRKLSDVFPITGPIASQNYETVFTTGEPRLVSGMEVATEHEGVLVERAYDVAYVPILTNGAAEGVLIVASEVSERVAREKAQRQTIESLEKLDRMKDEFLSILSHELRTPINAIMGFGSILDDEVAGPLTGEQHQYVAKILGGSDTLLSLVNDLLDMSRITAGKLTIDEHDLNFAAMAQDVISAMTILADRKEQRLLAELPEDLPHVMGDAQRVRQVLTNLINNAIKFTPPGGAIRVRACRDGDCVRCEVQDTGIGISDADRARLFRRFTQLDSSYTREAGGIGLGLSIAKSLVEAHGGEIGLVSAGEGRGSTFWFTLPLAVSRDVRAAEEPIGHRSAGGRSAETGPGA